MTEDNRKENIRAELGRATEAIAAATLLYENGFISDAVSRLYYFVLYHVRALLLSKGLEPRSHDGGIGGHDAASCPPIPPGKVSWTGGLPTFFQSL